MGTVVDVLSSSPMLLLFAVIGFGYLIGSIKVAGFSLGPAAVLFVGIFFGALDPRLHIPEIVYVLGQVLFVYTIGLQSGASFFGSFGRRALRANIFTFIVVLAGAVMTYAAWALFRLNGPSMVGVFCGALTSTPALAGTIDVLRHIVRDMPAGAEHSAITNAPVIGYSVAYPFGVIGVLLGFYVYARMEGTRKRPAADVDAMEETGTIGVRTFEVVNAEAVGKTVAQVLAPADNKGFVLSRLRRGRETTLAYRDAVLQKGDLVVAVGTPAALDRAREIFGKESPRDIHTENPEFDFRRIEVSDHRVLGRTIGELRTEELLDATITRIRRGDVDFVPTGDTILERGDRIRVLTWAGNIDRLCRFFGDSVKSSSETDFLSLSLGLVLGVLLGMIPFPLPGGSSFTLGFAGGPLIAGLVLGRVVRTGPVIWGMPFGVNVTLRQVGLVFFLAGVGTKAGDGFVQTLVQGGWKLMMVGGVMTAVVTVMALVLSLRFLRLSLPGAMGFTSGIQTQTACLAYANEHATSNAPNVWYASVYPVAMIAKIILAQLLAAKMF